MELQSTAVKRLYLNIADQLSRQILSGALAEGDRLPSERDLAQRFEVSRPTIREALIALEVSDLVDIRSGSGVYVKAPPSRAGQLFSDVPGPIEILEARLAFEGEAAALAAQRIDQEGVLGLETTLQAMTQLSGRDTAREELEDERFHLKVADASGNSAIATTVRWLWEVRRQSEVCVAFHQRLRQRGSEPVLADHRRILDALLARDPEFARSAMRQHLRRVIDEFSRYATS